VEQRKSSVDEIRARFDVDVERFSNLETGQSATIDAPLALELVACAALAVTPHCRRLLDLGCGAGNFSLRMLAQQSCDEVVLVDLSLPMLERSRQRIRDSHQCAVEIIQEDVRNIDLPKDRFDVVLAGAVLHHLRSVDQWESVFEKVFRSLRPGGSFWVFDLVIHPHPQVQSAMWQRYGQFLSGLGGEAYRDEVFAYIEKEDTPQTLWYQLKLLETTGFTQIDVLHYNTCFAAFGGAKPVPVD